MVRRVMKDAFVVWKNSRSIFGLTNYFAGQPRVAGAILSILFGLFLSACGGGGGAGSPPNVTTTTTTTLLSVTCAPYCPIFVDAPVEGLHYRQVGPVTLISRSQETGDVIGEDDPGGFDPGNYGTVAFAVGEITVVGEISVSDDRMTTVTVDNGDGLTLSQYKSNGFLGFIVHPAEEWINTLSKSKPVVFTPYDLRDADGNTVNVGAVARVLQGFDETPPSTFPGGINDDDNVIMIHPGATAERTVIIDRSNPAGQFSVRESDETDIVEEEDHHQIVISMAPRTENSPGYGGATLNFPLHSNAMRTLSMVIADMADEIARFSDNSTITLKNKEARTGYFARRGAYSLVLTNLASIDPHTGSLNQYTVTSGNPPEVTVKFEYAGIARNQVIELDSLPKLKTEPEEDKTSQPFQIYFTGGKPVALTLDEATGGNLPLRYELEQLSELKRYDLIFDHESGILSGTPQQEAFTVDVALDIFDSGGDDVKPLGPDLEFQIVSREGAPAYYEIDLRGGAGSFATLHFPDRNGNTVYQKLTEKSIAGIDSNCQKILDPGPPEILDPAGTPDFVGRPNCPYNADYVFRGEGMPGVMVMVGLKSIVPGDNTICAGNGGICPAGVKMFTIYFRNVNDGKTLSVNARVLLPRPAFDPAFASESFATYIAGSPNPSRRPLPAADGGNGRLIYSVTPLTVGLTLHSATRRLLGRPTVSVSNNMPDMPVALTMTVADLNGKTKLQSDGTSIFLNSDSYIFTVVVQPDHKPILAVDATAAIFIVDLSVAMTLTLPEAADGNRETRYSAITEDAPPGMMNFDRQTRELSGTPTEAASLYFVFDYIATDPDEDYDENGIPHPDDDDITILMISVFVDGKPSFGAQTTVPTQNYIANSQITDLTLSVATGGNGSLTYTLDPVPTGLTFDSDPTVRVLSGTPTGGATVITLIYTVTDSDLAESDSATLSVTVNIVGDAKPSFDGVMFDDRNYIETWPIALVTLPGVASDGNGDTTYTIAGLPEGLDFDRETRELSGTPEVALAETFQVLLIASDSDGNNADTDRSTLVFNIMLEDEVAPTLSAVSNQNYIQNSPITNLTLPEATGGNGSVTMYSLTTLGGLTFNSDHTVRVLSGTPRVFGDFTLNYIATDSDPLTPEAGPDSATVSITINIEEDTVPSFTESVPQQNYFQGASIAMTVLPEASGGNGDPLTYEESGLPTGIMFDRASRQLSGAPTEPGSFVATIVARDTDGNTDESDNGVLTFGISVEADTQPSFGSLTVSNQTYTLSVRISPLRLPAATGGNGQLIYSVSDDLPPGLEFNDNTQTDNTRIINLTPTTAGTYTVVYTVEDGDGDTRSLTFTITVVAS